MKMRDFRFAAFLLAIILFSLTALTAQELETIKLLSPQKDGGIPLMQALNKRQSTKSFSAKEIPLQALSDLLWAAWGINRADISKRTAPSSSNRQEMDIYVAMQEGLYLYDAINHVLIPVLKEDLRAATGRQDYVKDAPVNLVYVADYSKMGDGSEEDKRFSSAANTGFISQNVYLYCASEGLGTVVRGNVDKPALEKAMKLRPEQKVVLAQTIGYPK